MLVKLESAKSISYHETAIQKNPFNNDTSVSHIKTTLFLNRKGKLPYADIVTTTDKYNSREVYSGDKHYYFNDDSTYTIRDYKLFEGRGTAIFTSNGLKNTIEKILYNTPNKIRQLNDTLIDGRKCFYFFINKYDSIISGRRHYANGYIAIEKQDFLPKSYIDISYGTIMKGDNIIGDFSFYSKSEYSDFKINIGKNSLANFIVSKGYKPYAKKELLKEGTLAPFWKGENINGVKYSSDDFKGKVLLLFLSETSCPANQLSIKMMNNLVSEYQNKDLVVLGLYGDNKKSMEKYLEVNMLRFPAIYDAHSIKERYNAPGSPYFYIIDKVGKIAYRIYGYSDELEKFIGNELQKALSQ